MLYIVITLPHFFPGEAAAITAKFQAGLERLHLRKPGSTIDECRRLLREIPACYHDRIVIHDHFGLLEEFGLCGVHLNSRNPSAPDGWKGHVSISCHSIEELAACKGRGFTYMSLSPIFNSISKAGYTAAFSNEEIFAARDSGIIDSSVMALGGVCSENISKVAEFGFGGVMVLGDAWR